MFASLKLNAFLTGLESCHTSCLDTMFEPFGSIAKIQGVVVVPLVDMLNQEVIAHDCPCNSLL